MIVLKFWKEGLLAFLISILLYSGYKQIYNSGYTAAETKYTQVIEEYQQKQLLKVVSVERAIQELVSNTQEYNQLLSQDITTIKVQLKNTPLVVYKDGKCTIAKEFLDSRDKAINRANQR